MNITNLQLIRNHTAKVVGNKLRMSYFRVGESPDAETPICKSVGCILGHATVLDKENVTDNFTCSVSGINFSLWSEDFLEMNAGGELWVYLFGPNQHLDIKDYHLYRMDYIIAGNCTPNVISISKFQYGYYDDGYFIPKGVEI